MSSREDRGTSDAIGGGEKDVSWLRDAWGFSGASGLLSQVSEQLFEAAAGGGVPFDLAVPSAACCVVDELLFYGKAGP